jgi:hypothetical protein
LENTLNFVEQINNSIVKLKKKKRGPDMKHCGDLPPEIKLKTHPGSCLVREG